MDTGKNELTPEVVQFMKELLEEEFGQDRIEAPINTFTTLEISEQRIRDALNDSENKYTPDGYMLLESMAVYQEEQERLHESPLKGVLGHVTKVSRTGDGQTFDIKLNERGREFVNDIYKKQRFDRDDVQYPTNWDEVWNEIYKS